MKIFFVFIFLLIPKVVMADAAADLSGLLTGYDSVSGRFQQTLVDDENQLIQESSGTFIVKKPGYFRWDTTAPFPQLLVSDLKTIWLYDPDLEQVTIRSYKNNVDQTPALLLSGDLEKITETYEVIRTTGEADQFTLIPRLTETTFTELRLIFTDKQLTTMVLLDKLQQTTTFNFSQLQLNNPVAVTSFQFTPPAGVDVLIDE